MTRLLLLLIFPLGVARAQQAAPTSAPPTHETFASVRERLAVEPKVKSRPDASAAKAHSRAAARAVTASSASRARVTAAPPPRVAARSKRTAPARHD
jgi:hypothetical protein